MAFGLNHESHLLSPEEALQAVIQNAPVSIAVIDGEGRLMFAAGKGLELIDLTGEMLVGAKATEIFPEQKRIPELVREVFSGRTVTATLDLKHRVADLWGSPIRNTSGKIAAAIVVATDVTERERSLRKLAETDRILSLAEQAAQFGIWYSDPSQQGDLVWSDGAYRIFGLSRKEFDGKVETFFKMVHPGDIDEVRKASLEALAGRSRYNVKHRIIRPDGQTRWVHQEAEVIFGPDKKPLQMVGMTHDITDRKRAEDSLRESESRYRAIIETSPVPIAIHQDGRFAYVNQACADLLLVPEPRDMIDTDIYEIIHPDFREIVRARVKESTERGRPSPPSAEEKLIRRDGTSVDVEVVGSSIMLKGRPAGLVFIRDISRRKKREAELNASERRFRTMIENSYELIHLIDADGKILYMGPSVRRFLGYEPEETIGMTGHDFLHPDDAAAVSAGFAGLVKTPGYVTPPTPMRLRRKDGSYIPIEAVAQNLLYVPEVAAIVVHSRDVSVEKAARQEMEESQARYRTLFETADDAIIVIESRSGTVVDCNKKAEKLLQRPRGEIVGLDQKGLFPPGLEDRYVRYLNERLARGQAVSEQIYVLRKDGTQVPVKISASPASIEGGMFVTGVFHDVTEEVRTTEELKRRNLELEQFVKLTTGRENRMMELKKENEELRRKLSAQS